MENKSNSLNRIKRHQREKVLRFSIRKYSFGAASVAIAALMFLGARVVSADTVSGSSSPSTAGVVQPNDKGDSPVGIKDENKSEVANNSLENKEVALVENSSNTVDKSQLRTVVEELNSLLSTKLNLDDSVLSSVKERVQRAQALLDKADAVQKDINELKELLSADLATLSNAVKESSEVRESNTGTEAEKPANQSSPEVRASEESQTVSAKKDSLKLSVDQLQAAISEVPEHDTTKEVLEKANEVMVLAQGVLQNTTVSLTDVEQMNKLVKRMFNSVKNATLRLSSGSHDPRNGQRMTQGTGERAAAVSSRWTNQDNLLSYQRFRATDENGRVRNDDRQFTENKVDMTARIETIDGVKYAVYDIFFNNDGKSMVRLSRQQLYNVILPPKILDLQSSGAYKSDTIRDLHFDTYRRNNQNESGTLSQNPDKFTYESTQNFHFLNDNGQSKGNLTYFYNLGVRQSGRSYDQDMKDYFKNNKNDPFLKKAVALDGVNKSWSYGIGVRTNNPTAAVHMHFKAKLRSDVTDEAVKKAFILAIAGTYGETTNQSYVFGSGKNDNENVEPTVKQSAKYPISGREVTKKVDAPLGDLDKPVDAGFVTGNNNFPTDIRWSWPDGKPNTTTAGVFRYKVKAQYSDNTSNTTDAILKVLPNKPEIDQKSVNEKAGKTGQTVTVNVGKGVPDNSTVTLYSGNTVIGTGNTKGTTATITVSKALPSTAITAKTTVKNNGTVESEFSAPVTPTEVPDKAAPTVLINGKKLTENADDNRFIIYRGANFNPTFRVQDDKSNHVNLSITGLPNGVANVTTSGGKEFNYTIPDNTVANEAPFGESIASVVASDGRNSATYKFKYRIVDIQAKNSTTENRALGSALGDPHDHFKVAESNTVENDKYYPTGMQFKWIELNRSTITTTDVPNTTNLNELGNVTKYVATAVFPAVKNTKEIDRVNYTIYSPKQKAIPITFNVTDNVKPTVKLVGDNGSDTTLSESTPEANLPKVTVYRGEKANVTIKASDNTGKIKELRGSGMPNGIWFNKNPNANSEVWLSSDNATETNPLSHTITGVVEKDNRIEEKTVTINASDKADPSNVTTVKFKMVVKEQKDKYTPTAGTTPVAVNNIGSISTSDLDKIKNSVTVPNLSPEATQDGGVTKTLKDNGRVTVKNGKNYVTVEVTYPDRSKDEVPVEVQQNTNVQKQPTIYVVKGETISNEELRKFVYLPNGAQKEELPSTATVTATLDTATKGSKTTNVTVTFQGSTPVVVPVTYEVIQNFPVANKVYDFAGVSRGNGASDYYVNQGLRQGMSWFVEKETVEGGQKVFKKVSNDNNMNSQIASDITAGVGEYRYKLGAKFREGRFTNQAEEASRLSYSGEIVHTVYDVVANTTKVEATYGSTLTNSQAQSAVMKATNSQNLPTGTTYEWVANALGAVATNLTVSTYGEETRYVKVTLPKTREAGPDSAAATQVNPFKVIEVKVKVNETVKPTVKLVSDNGDVTLSESTPEANLPKVTVYRGEKANVTIKASDNTGKIKELRGSGMPNGIWFNKNPNANSEVWLSSDNATETNPLSHTITGVVEKGNRIEEKIVTIKATDKTEPSNVTTVKFKMVVKEQKDKYTPTAGTTVKVGNIGTISQPDGDKIKNSVTVPNLSPEATQDGGVTKTLKDNGRVTVKNGKNYVTVEVTYPDRSKDEVDVAVEEVLKAGEKNPTNKAVDGQPYISNEKVINPNKEDATFTATRTNGLTVGTEGKVTGIPTGITWTGNETEKIVKIPVTVTRTGETPVNVEISVVVQRDVTKTPTFTVGTQDPTTGNVDVTVSGVPNGTKVKLPGVKGEKVVTDGKVTLPNDELPETPQTGKGSAQEEGKLPKEGTSDITIPGKISSSKGEPEVQTETPDYTNPISSNGVDGNGNLIDPPTVELPEFNGGVNGELPEPITLPELTIEVRWIDEDGNVLKPSVKTGSEKDAEHGSILGYEFVRTVIDENEPAITHIFRKVSGNTIPVTPDTKGNSGQDTPAPTPATPTPNADQVDTKTTVDNGAKSNDSQNVLPNTGTESNATLASLGLLGLLSGFGLVARKKKED